ncbi:MAG: flagellar hook-basal body complex protein FliE [Thiohalomonadaceae bacterium]
MNTIDTSQLLTQLRAAAAAARGTTAENPAAAPGVNFSSFLQESIGQVNALQQQSAQMKTAVSMGDTSVSLVDTMIASSKAELGFQAMVQTRNKLVEAYQEIMRMQV